MKSIAVALVLTLSVPALSRAAEPDCRPLPSIASRMTELDDLLKGRRTRVEQALERMEEIHRAHAWALTGAGMATATATALAAIPVAYAAAGLTTAAAAALVCTSETEVATFLGSYYFTELAFSGASGGVSFAGTYTDFAWQLDSPENQNGMVNFADSFEAEPLEMFGSSPESALKKVESHFDGIRTAILSSRDELLHSRTRETGWMDSRIEKHRDQEIRIIAARALAKSFTAEIRALNDVSCAHHWMHVSRRENSK